MGRRKNYVMYVRHDDRKLHLAVRAQAAKHGLTLSEFVEVAMQHFLGMSEMAQSRAVKKGK